MAEFKAVNRQIAHHAPCELRGTLDLGILIRDGDSYGVGLWKAVATEIDRLRLPEKTMPRSRH